MVGLRRLAQLGPAFSEGGSIRHLETPSLVAGETSAQTASVLENATGLLEKGWPVLDSGPDCAYELNAAGGRLPESRFAPALGGPLEQRRTSGGLPAYAGSHHHRNRRYSSAGSP